MSFYFTNTVTKVISVDSGEQHLATTYLSEGFMVFARATDAHWLCEFITKQCWRLDSERMEIKVSLVEQSIHYFTFSVVVNCLRSGKELHSFMHLVVRKNYEKSLAKVNYFVYKSDFCEKPQGALMTRKEYRTLSEYQPDGSIST